MKSHKAKNAAKIKLGEKRTKAKGVRDLPALAVSTKIRGGGGRLAANHVELALLGS